MHGRSYITFIYSLLCLLFAGNIYATDLMEAYRDALDNDPSFAAARSQYKADAEGLPQAISHLLPFSAVNLTATDNSNYGTTFVGTQHRHTRVVDLSINQPIINLANWSTVSQARATKAQSQMLMLDAAQDLIIRLTEAYLAVLEAADNLSFTLDEKRAFKQQLHQSTERFKVGLDPITDVHDSQARYHTAMANEINAKNNLSNRFEDLRAITGKSYRYLVPLRHEIELASPKPTDSCLWEKTAVHHNFNVLANHFAVKSAMAAIGIAQAGHFPTLDAFFDYSDTYLGAAGPGNPRRHNRSENLGLRLEIPIYQGGGVLSSTRQARYNRLTALSNFEVARRNAVNLAHQSYNDVISGINQVKANRQVLISNEALLNSTNEAYKVGTRTIVDVLDARQDLTSAQQAHANSQYTYINATLALKRAAGSLSVEDVKEINRWLIPGNSKKVHRKKVRLLPEQRIEQLKMPEYININDSEILKDYEDQHKAILQEDHQTHPKKEDNNNKPHHEDADMNHHQH